MNITREEALNRSKHLSVTSYDVYVDLTGENVDEPDVNFISKSDVTFTSDGEPTWADLMVDRVVEASLDGAPIDPASYADNRLPLKPAPGEHLLSVTALGRYSHTGEGLHRTVDPADGRVYLYTQLEPADAGRLYACFEQPDLKALFHIVVKAPAGWVVLSNSAKPVLDHTPSGVIWNFPETPPLSTYVTAMIAGEYHVDHGTIQSRKGEIPAALVCRQSMKDYLDVERLRTTTQRGFDVYEKAFGIDYPFDSYDQIFVPEYNAGAMENAGCVTIRDEYLWRSRVTAAEVDARDNTILHELAHMWFGDLVTMRWWDDIWLNESFAEWASHYCQAEIVKQYGGDDPWPGFTAGRKGWAFRQDQLPTTHPVAADMVDLDAVRQNFDGITYAKGASVLRQLVGLVGENDFLVGVRAYLNAHEYGNASLDDLLSALQEASGKDLSGFTADWLTTAGMNTLRMNVAVDGKGVITAASVTQTAPEAHPTWRHHHLGIGCYDMVDGKLVRISGFELDVAGPTTDVPQLVGQPRPALLLLNDGDMTFAKVRLDDVSLATAIAHAADIKDALARTVTFATLQDMWRDAELPSGQFVTVVLACLAGETDMTALRSRLQLGRQAAVDYSAASVRPANQAAWTKGLAALLQTAAPGSDPQLALATALINGSTVDDTATIKHWLYDENVPTGLPIDTDLRWLIVTALARLGRADDALIEQTLAFDHTQTGMEHAAGARAALLDADAKAAAWQLATQSADVPNETLVQTCENFWNFGQENVTRQYAAKYWDVAEAIASGAGIWKGRGDAAVDTVLTHLWPMPVADDAFVTDAEKWLAARPTLATPVAKIVTESIDRTKRMLKAQAASVAPA